jgi:hypothetical protein
MGALAATGREFGIVGHQAQLPGRNTPDKTIGAAMPVRGTPSRVQCRCDHPAAMTEDRSAPHGRERAVIAYTTGDDRHWAVRAHAVRHAREDGCTVILYDAEAASTFSDPMPNQWGSEGEGRGLGDRLDPDELEFLGRESLATQIREARAGDVQAYGWLPKDHGPRALAEYAIEQGAHVVFVPAELEAMDELSSILAGAPNAIDSLREPGMPIERVGSEVPAADRRRGS